MKEDKGNVGVLNDSVLHVLKEHCGIGVEKQKVSRKLGRKITPGERIVSLGREDVPGSSKENVNPLSKRKKNKNKNRKKINSSEDLWICSDWDCGEEWDDESNDRWVVCDSCSDRFHLQCSGIEYETSNYWDIDFESMVFECDSSIDFFSE